MLDKSTVIEKAGQYAKAIKKEFSPYSIVLFGSYLNGNANEDSDIDIGVIFNGFNGDWLAVSTRLWCLRHGISWDIEPHLLDIANDDSGFANYVLRNGQVL